MITRIIQRAAGAVGVRIVRKDVLHDLIPRENWPPTPLTPAVLGAICNHCDRLEPAKQSVLSREILTITALDPRYGAILLDPLAWSHAPRHPLTFQIGAASLFARGHLREAAILLSDANRTFPSAFNALCLARTLEAMDDPTAESVLRREFARWPDDLFLRMQLATHLARADREDEADALLQPVRGEFEDERRSLAPLQAEIEEAMASNRLQKTETRDIYSEDFVLSVWWSYWWSHLTYGEYQDGNVGLDHAIRRVLRPVLSKKNIRTFVDFGAFCAYTIYRLAQDFPEIRFVGIDRPAAARDLNQQGFALPNLEYIAGDALEYIASTDFGPDTAFFHTRTACFCYPEYLRRLYEVCRRQRFGHIFCAESTTFSRWLLRFFAQGQFPTISLAARGATFVHDYKRLLGEAGYRIAETPSIQPWLLLDERSGFGADHRIWHGVLD